MQDPEGDRDPSHLLVACNHFHRRHNDPFLRALFPNGIPRSSAVEMLQLLCLFHALKTLWMKLSAPLAVTVPLTDSLSPASLALGTLAPCPSLLFFRGLPFLQPRYRVASRQDLVHCRQKPKLCYVERINQ